MEDPQSSLAIATKWQDGGNIKDAFNAYVSLAQRSLETFSEVRFVHNSIVALPIQHTIWLSTLRACLVSIGSILDNHAICSSTPDPASRSKAVLRPEPPALPPKPIIGRRIRQGSYGETDSYLCPDPVAPSTVGQPKESQKRSDPTRVDRIVADGHVDVSRLVPAQTDGLTDELMDTSHIPRIPVSPLLTTHRALQAKLDEVQSVLKEYEAQERVSKDPSLKHIIRHHSPLVVEAKQTLAHVRTLSITAATIPTVLHFSPFLIAYQLTLIDSALFRAMPSHALLAHSATTPHPRIVASTDFFNYLTRVIEHSILLPQDASVRAQHVNHWIKVASRCLDLQNHQSLKAIVSALGTPPIQRLKRTWAFVPKKSLTRLDTMTDLMSEANNYHTYRQHSLTLDLHTPTVPFLGLWMLDMTYLLAANRSNPHNDPRIQAILGAIESHQQAPPFNPIPASYERKNMSFGPNWSSALQKSAASMGRLGSSISSISNISINNISEEEAYGIEDQQQLVTQYLLMRPWLSQSGVDGLSVLREPPQQKHLSLATRSSHPLIRFSANSNSSRTNSSCSSSSFEGASHRNSMDASTMCSSPETAKAIVMEEPKPQRRHSAKWLFRRSLADRPVVTGSVSMPDVRQEPRLDFSIQSVGLESPSDLMNDVMLAGQRVSWYGSKRTAVCLTSENAPELPPRPRVH
ncbi:ras guanine nucleotide exchange factor domain-containing protein [Phycomyces nitens]|nr:ras guanine nucleotide exchange factor domain-containing protein [Phycomyces nitens]